MSPPLRIVFMGTPEFAVPSLEALLHPDFQDVGKVVGVVTQPDRPKGRGHHLTPPPIKLLAERHGLPVAQPLKMKDPEFLNTLGKWSPDLIAVTAFGRILPPVILDLPPRGCVNVHGSLLPKYRGAAPIQWAIINGNTETGITTMLMDPGMDTGPMLMQERLAILPEETAGELASRLAPLGGRLLTETIRGLLGGGVKPIVQDATLATLAPLLKKEDGVLHWQDASTRIVDRVRGLTPWPGASTYYGDERWLIRRAEAANTGDSVAEAGTILEVTRDAIHVAAGTGSVLIHELQPSSGKRLAIKQYLAGHAVKIGAKLTLEPLPPIAS
jgi:methionyl-tRNA formyltransferase